MQVFWCSTFLPPAAVIKDCERILRRFLWGSSGTSRKHSLVKWSNVCLPRQEGGLGIKSLKAWNQALHLKQIWSLLNDHSLWVQWCKLNLIRKHIFWTLLSSGSLSWSWRQILLLRNTALTHLVYVCGKGDRFSLWYDPWFHWTSIYAIYGHRVIYDAGLVTSELVHVVIENDQWCWPTTSPDLLDIPSHVQDIPITSSPDFIFWETVGRPFSTKQAWKSIRTTAPHVVWAKLVWYPSCISKHAFCLWLAIQGALKTLDKLLHKGILPSASCLFNCGDNENVDHLFFACPYAQRIWIEVLSKCNIYRPILPWQEEVQWMADHARGNKPPQVFRKLAIGETLYHIWVERNRRSFRNCFLPPEAIIHKIQDDVAAKMVGHKITLDHSDEHHHSLGVNWGIVG
ncbi:zf-RVT domain-containing protein [Cephalotus follicularis]|uniref:Zf-RVT domain-containing protein n=1 Tax=Cephalotus follicularis TaxID=3775 RepID=A0A1Q3BDZ7_CEPFO|nr:zf-RVT domain-containing protein [Cephalotus follicularis]